MKEVVGKLSKEEADQIDSQDNKAKIKTTTKVNRERELSVEGTIVKTIPINNDLKYDIFLHYSINK